MIIYAVTLTRLSVRRGHTAEYYGQFTTAVSPPVSAPQLFKDRHVQWTTGATPAKSHPAFAPCG